MPLFWFSAFFICGVVLGAGYEPGANAWVALGSVCLLLSGLPFLARRLNLNLPQPPPRISEFVRSHRIPNLLLCLSLLFFGAARFTATRFVLDPEQIAWFNDREAAVTVEAEVVGAPELRDGYVLLEIAAEDIRLEEAGESIPVQGKLLAKAPPQGSELSGWRYGDRLQLTGRLETPFESEEFSYLDYLAHRGIHSVFYCFYPADESCAALLSTGGGSPVYRAIFALRERLTAALFQLFPDPEASLLAGILFGVEGTIPAPVRDAFNDTGTSHVIAISGFNFAIVAGLFAVLFSRLLGRWKGLVAAFVAIAVYAVLAGAGAGVVRAAIMGGLAVFAAQIGRRSNGLNSLLFVAALMVLHDPHVLWDVSFQLSFMATLGLILYADPLQGWFTSLTAARLPAGWSERLRGPVGEFFLFTLAAQLTTLPLILYYFGRLSPVSLAANPLILPAQPPVMILGGLAALLGALWLPAGQAAAWIAWPFVVYTIRVVEALAVLPGGALSVGEIHPAWIIGFYILLLGTTAFGRGGSAWLERRGGTLLQLLGAALLAVLIANTLVWRSALSLPDGRLHLTMLDVGEGDAFLVETPNGRRVLIDGGPSPARLSDALGRRLPWGRRSFDWWLTAAAGDEQLAALPGLVERFLPGQVLWAGPPEASYGARRLRAALIDAGIPIETAQVGQSLDLGDGARLEVMATTPKGAVLLLSWGRFRALLPVGQDFESLEALQEDDTLTGVTALMLADSGRASLNPPEWISRLQPQVILVSVAAGDRLGRPDAEMLAALEGFNILRTDRNGWIELSTDGERLWVEVEGR